MSSHSNPLFSSAPGGDLDASVDIQSAALPTVHEAVGDDDALLEARQRYAATPSLTPPTVAFMHPYTRSHILNIDTYLLAEGV